jgi:glycosyltransferase involved in cell wall biosynthesis
MPNVVLEALAAGVPVVAPAVGDLPSIVPSNCGMLVAPDADELAAAVVAVLSKGTSDLDVLQRRMRETAETYSVEAMAGRTVAVWRGVWDAVCQVGGTSGIGAVSASERADA